MGKVFDYIFDHKLVKKLRKKDMKMAYFVLK